MLLLLFRAKINQIFNQKDCAWVKYKFLKNYQQPHMYNIKFRAWVERLSFCTRLVFFGCLPLQQYYIYRKNVNFQLLTSVSYSLVLLSSSSPIIFLRISFVFCYLMKNAAILTLHVHHQKKRSKSTHISLWKFK